MPLVVNPKTLRAERGEPVDMPERIDLGAFLLRRPRLEDAASLFEAYGRRAAVTRWLSIAPVPSVEAMRDYLAILGTSWEDRSEFAYVFVDPDLGDIAPVGMINVRFKVSYAHFGYVLAESHWGRGWMSRALAETVDLALAQPDIWRVEAECAVGNPASARVMEKAGMRLEGTLRRRTVFPSVSMTPSDVLQYARTRDD